MQGAPRDRGKCRHDDEPSQGPLATFRMRRIDALRGARSARAALDGTEEGDSNIEGGYTDDFPNLASFEGIAPQRQLGPKARRR